MILMLRWKTSKVICNANIDCTQILIWFLEGNKLLSKSRRRIIADSSNDVYVSIASLWEMAIKISIGKLILAKPLANVIKQIAVENIEVLGILPEHTLQVSTLPFHHRDPFDRIIASQAQIENLEVMSDDKEFLNYVINLL